MKTTNPNYFSYTNYFFSVQLGHPKLSGYDIVVIVAKLHKNVPDYNVFQCVTSNVHPMGLNPLRAPRLYTAVKLLRDVV